MPNSILKDPESSASINIIRNDNIAYGDDGGSGGAALLGGPVSFPGHPARCSFPRAGQHAIRLLAGLTCDSIANCIVITAAGSYWTHNSARRGKLDQSPCMIDVTCLHGQVICPPDAWGQRLVRSAWTALRAAQTPPLACPAITRASTAGCTKVVCKWQEHH